MESKLQAGINYYGSESMGAILKNKEYQIMINCLLAVCILFAAAGGILYHILLDKLNKDLIRRDIAIIGAVAEENPEQAEKIVGYYVNKPDDQYFDKGLKITDKYGYNLEMKLSNTVIIRDYKGFFTYFIVAIILALSIVCLFIIYLTFRYLYQRLRHLASGADSIMKGDFNIKFPDNGEGELPVIGFQFNQMSNRLQQTLKELNSDKELLKNIVSDISHQLKTPLSSLIIYNELLLDGMADDPLKRKELLDKSLIQLERMKWLIQTLLKISKLEAGVIEMDFKEHNLMESVHNVTLSLEPKLHNKNISLELIDVKDKIIWIYDIRWFEEALVNIINNAIEHSYVGGKINISADVTDTTIQIKVSDFGEGIDAEDLPHIFKRFYRGGNKKGNKSKGSGIGLSLSKLIVEKHVGVIKVNSEPGKGSIFTLTFPKINPILTKL